MNFYTPQRGKNETREQYIKRRAEQKHYKKRGCVFFRCQPFIDSQGQLKFTGYHKHA